MGNAEYMGFKTKHPQREEVKMADNVSFKVYLKDPSQGEETEVRRFVVDKEVSTSLLRMPLPTVLAGHLLYSAISFLHPICALFLLLPCLHKLHVRGQPLGDP